MAVGHGPGSICKGRAAWRVLAAELGNEISATEVVIQVEPNEFVSFEDVQIVHKLMATNMPVLRNNPAYFPMPTSAFPRYWEDKALSDPSRIPILFE